MGTTRGPYKAEYPVGTTVRIAKREILEQYLRPQWKYHNPLEIAQLAHAERTAAIRSVGFYHGGDEVYYLEGVPGIWHEACLHPISGT